MPSTPHPQEGPGRPPGMPPAGALDRLLRDLGELGLGSRIRRGGPATDATPRRRCATGIAAVDRVLEGGFPRGRLSEITGPPSSGRTSLALALLAAATAAGELVALVDASDAFAPDAATAAGVDLGRVLWARAPRPVEALRGAECLLQTAGFALVLLDLAHSTAERSSPAWLRLARVAAASDAALVVLASGPLAGSCAALRLEMQPAGTRFAGTPALFEGLETRAVVVRNRLGAPDRATSLRLHAA